VRSVLGGPAGCVELPVSLVRRVLPQRAGKAWLLQSQPVLRRWIRRAKADPETYRSPVLTSGVIYYHRASFADCATLLNLRVSLLLKRTRFIEIATTSLVLLLTPAWRLKMMIRTMLLTAAALASVSFAPGNADAAAPYCAVISLGPGNAYWDCQYRSFEDCYHRGMILAGNRGFCNTSPYYVPGYVEQRPTRKRTVRPY